MRKYTLTSDALKMAGENMRDKVYEWCRAEGAPSINTIFRIDLIPSRHAVVYHLVSSVEMGDDGQPCIKTIPFEMPMKNRPTWVDLCTMTEV